PRGDGGGSRDRIARLGEPLGHTGRAGHDYDPRIEQQLARHERVRCQPEHAYSTWYGDHGVHAAVRGLAASDQSDWRAAAPCRSGRLSADDAIGGDSRFCGSGGRVDIAGGPSPVVAHAPGLPVPRSRRLALTAMACLTIAACHQGGGVGAAATESGWNGALTLRVVNHSWLDVTIFVLQGTHRERVGTATATSTTEFHLPLQHLTSADYRLFADPIGSRQTVRSEPLHAQDGDVVTWRLQADWAGLS